MPDPPSARSDVVTPARRRELLRVGGRIVGSLLREPTHQYWSGRPVRTLLVRHVRVSPGSDAAHHLRVLLERLLHDARREGFAAVAFAPGTPRPAADVGLGPAWGRWTTELSPERLRITAPPGARRRITAAQEPWLRDLYRSTSARYDGYLQRPESLWEQLLHGSGKQWRGLTFEGEGSAYAIWHDTDRRGHVRLVDAHATEEAGWLRILHALAEMRVLFQRVELSTGPTDPLWMLVDPLAVSPLVLREMGLLRIVHPHRALEQRGWSGREGAVTIGIQDPMFGSAAYSLVVHRGVAEVVASPVAQVWTSARGFSALYSGWCPPRTLAELGLLHASPRVLDALTGLFAGPPAWMRDDLEVMPPPSRALAPGRARAQRACDR